MKIAERPKSERSDGRIPDISNYHPDPRTGPPVAFRPFRSKPSRALLAERASAMPSVERR